MKEQSKGEKREGREKKRKTVDKEVKTKIMSDCS